jgi:dihydrofolate reductase
LIGLIWAQAGGGVLGRDNAIPWHLPEDMKHFREVTAGSTVLMGRRTWESLPPRFRPLPGRRNLVLTRSRTWTDDGAEPVRDLDAALSGDVWVIGGADVYAAALPRADVLEITEVDLDVPGDVHAPAIGDGWRVDSDSGWQTSTNGPRFRWLRYLRRP